MKSKAKARKIKNFILLCLISQVNIEKQILLKSTKTWTKKLKSIIINLACIQKNIWKKFLIKSHIVFFDFFSISVFFNSSGPKATNYNLISQYINFVHMILLLLSWTNAMNFILHLDYIRLMLLKDLLKEILWEP